MSATPTESLSSSRPLAWALHLVRRQTLSMTDDLEKIDWCRQDHEGETHPAWILGHLLLADHYLLHLLQADALPEDFAVLLADFGPGARPRASAAAYDLAPTTVRDRLRATGSERDGALANLPTDGLARPLADPLLATSQPTLGHHLQSLVFHEGHHGGQLSAWRQRHGFSAVPWGFAPR